MLRQSSQFIFPTIYTTEFPCELKKSLENTLKQLRHRIQLNKTVKPKKLIITEARIVRHIHTHLFSFSRDRNILQLLLKLTKLLTIAASPLLSSSLTELALVTIKNTLDQLEETSDMKQIGLISDRNESTVQAMYHLHELINAKPFSKTDRYFSLQRREKTATTPITPLENARNQLYHETIQVLNQLYLNPHTSETDYQTIALSLYYSTCYLSNPFILQDKNFSTEWNRTINCIIGKPNYWRQFLGALLLMASLVLGALSIAGIFLSGGTSMMGIKIGYGVGAVGTALLGNSLFKTGLRHSLSHSLHQLQNKGQSEAMKIKKQNLNR